MHTRQRIFIAISLTIFAAACAEGSKRTPASPTAAPKTSQSQPTLAVVKARGVVNCRVSTGVVGFSAPDESGTWHGLDVDLCRALASAIFGDSQRVSFIQVTAEQRFVALQAGEVDLLARNSVWTLSRDTQLGLDFPVVTFYDGQGFMVRRDSGIGKAAQLKGATVCVQGRTINEFQLGQYNRAHGLNLRAVTFDNADQVLSAYDAGQCLAYSADSSALAGERLALSDPTAHIILPELISKEPLSPVVRHGDNQWADIVRWVHFARLTAEEKSITATNVEQVRRSSQDAETRLLLGVDGNMGEGLGLPRDWAYTIINQVGNYAESFEYNVGRATPLGMERGANALWSKGGLQYAPPVR